MGSILSSLEPGNATFFKAQPSCFGSLSSVSLKYEKESDIGKKGNSRKREKANWTNQIEKRGEGSCKEMKVG